MKKHGSATKRAFDELMSKSDAGAHRIGKDQSRQDITGHASASAVRRRGGKIETLSRETFSRASQTVSEKRKTVGAAPNFAGETDHSEAVRSASENSIVSPSKNVLNASGASITGVSGAPAVSVVAEAARVNRPGAQEVPRRAVSHEATGSVAGQMFSTRSDGRSVRTDVQNRTAAQTQHIGMSVSKPRRSPAAHAAVSTKQRPSGKSIVKRAAMGIVSAFAVIGVAVTVYAISADKDNSVSPDVFIGSGEARVSNSLSVESMLLDESIAADAAVQSDVSEAALPAPVEDESAKTVQSIDSRFTVTFTFYQEESVVCSTPETTVGALMERLGITTGEGKRMYVSSDDIISADTEIRIDTVEYKTEYGTEAVAFSTEYQDVRTIPRGSTKLYRSGKNGVKTVEYFCEYVNGQLANKETRGESITTAPTSQIMYRGVGGTIGGLSYSYYIDVKATTYTGGGTTASGLPANESVIAVDPSVIPLGTKVYVTGSYGDFGVRTAADTGGSIKGNKIDVYLERSNPYFGNFGWRNMRVYILG